MEYGKLDELLERAEALPRQRNMVIAHANEMHSIEMAVDMVRDGKADLLVKGMLETSQMLRPFLSDIAASDNPRQYRGYLPMR